MSLQDKMKQASQSEHSNLGGGYFKFKEGVNKLRILTEPEIYFADFKLGTCYTDCGFQGTPRGLAYVLDYADGAVKLARLPYSTVVEYLAGLQTQEDWAFDAFPMPYDIVIEAVGAGTKEVKYNITPRPVRTEIPQTVREKLAKSKTCLEIIEKWKHEQREKDMFSGAFQQRQEERAKLKADLDAVRPKKRSESVEDLPEIEYPEDDAAAGAHAFE